VGPTVDQISAVANVIEETWTRWESNHAEPRTNHLDIVARSANSVNVSE